MNNSKPCIPCVAAQRIYIQTVLKIGGRTASQRFIQDLAERAVSTGSIRSAQQLIDAELKTILEHCSSEGTNQ